MKETENVPFDSMPQLIRGSFLTKEQADKLKEPFKDVMSVVRCKDCKKLGFDDCPVYGWMPDKAFGDWFCADGEKR